MLHALISDIHSNLEALEAVIQDAESEGAQQYICLGDMVGYGAQPHECLERIRALGAIAVAGNHDYAVCGKTETTYFNSYARRAVFWTVQHVTSEDMRYLAGLSLVYRTDNFCMVHASLDDPAMWDYVLTEEDAERSFDVLKEQVLFIGHSHVPCIFTLEDGKISLNEPRDIELREGTRYIINVGSVGQPRDWDNRSCYCLYDAEKKTVRYRRVRYDFKATQKKILAAQLPQILAERLEVGR